MKDSEKNSFILAGRGELSQKHRNKNYFKGLDKNEKVPVVGRISNLFDKKTEKNHVKIEFLGLAGITPRVSNTSVSF